MNTAEDLDYAPLEGELRRYLANQPGHYGICCQDLNTGKSFGIDEEELFVQASCLKLAYVLCLYEQVSAGYYSLEQRLAYEAAHDYSDGSGYLQYFVAEGDRFSLRALAGVAITLSDNIAYRMIKRLLGAPSVLRYMEQMGMLHPRPNGEHCTTPRDMACCLRGVLNFIDRTPGLGARLLDDMTHPVWHDGLPLLLPDPVLVAHKEGDLDGVANDVGLVFLPGRPYLLAILSGDQPEIKSGFRSIAQISKLVYDFHRHQISGPESPG